MKQAYRPLPKLSDAEAERFRSKISCNGTDDCWPWTASCDENGRGMIRISGYLFKAPRVAYLLATGRDPGTQDVCHICDNPICCNPIHLWCGTRAANNEDRDAKGRQIAPFGEKHGCAVLTEAQVRTVLKSSLPGRYLASRLGVSESTISAIRHRRLWKHIHV